MAASFCSRRTQARRQPADRLQDIDGRIMPRRAQLARQNDVAVQNGAHRVADGFVEIVAFHQHGEKSGDGALAKSSGPLEDLRQQIKDRRRVAFLAGRLAGRQTDLALRHGQASHRIHHQQHVLALVAKIFRHRQRDKGGANAQRRGTIGSGHHQHGFLQPVGAQLVLDEIPHLAIALADQRDHADIGGALPRHRAQQRAFAHARATEDSDSLPFAASQQAVDGANAGGQRFDDRFALERPRRRRVKIVSARRQGSAPDHPWAFRIRRSPGPAVAAQPPSWRLPYAQKWDRPGAGHRSLRAASTARVRRESRSPACESRARRASRFRKSRPPPLPGPWTPPAARPAR